MSEVKFLSASHHCSNYSFETVSIESLFYLRSAGGPKKEKKPLSTTIFSQNVAKIFRKKISILKVFYYLEVPF
jgi:hypothetical protein